MARTSATNYTAQPFTYATAGTDIFKKEDVQVLAQAVDQHDHTTGKGLAIPAGAIPAGTITSAMIADGTITGTDIATGTITTTQIQDGTIATADLANAAVTNAKLGTDTARLNLLTNGGFEIWQRGNGPFTGNVWCADRWAIAIGGSDTMSVSQDSANADGAGRCAACTFTLSGGAGTTAIYTSHKVSEYGNLPGRTLSLGLRVRTSVANAARLFIQTDGTGGTTTHSAYHSGGGAYETLSLTLTVPSNATYVNLGVHFSASCTAYIDNAMLVVGSVAADYAPLHPADDLARCLRYYELIGETSGSIALNHYAAAGSAIQVMLPYKARKAVTPTVTASTTWTVTNCGQPSLSGLGVDVSYMQFTVTALGMAQVYSGTGARIQIEANP